MYELNEKLDTLANLVNEYIEDSKKIPNDSALLSTLRELNKKLESLIPNTFRKLIEEEVNIEKILKQPGIDSSMGQGELLIHGLNKQIDDKSVTNPNLIRIYKKVRDIRKTILSLNGLQYNMSAKDDQKLSSNTSLILRSYNNNFDIKEFGKTIVKKYEDFVNGITSLYDNDQKQFEYKGHESDAEWNQEEKDVKQKLQDMVKNYDLLIDDMKKRHSAIQKWIEKIEKDYKEFMNKPMYVFGGYDNGQKIYNTDTKNKRYAIVVNEKITQQPDYENEEFVDATGAKPTSIEDSYTALFLLKDRIFKQYLNGLYAIHVANMMSEKIIANKQTMLRPKQLKRNQNAIAECNTGNISVNNLNAFYNTINPYITSSKKYYEKLIEYASFLLSTDILKNIQLAYDFLTNNNDNKLMTTPFDTKYDSILEIPQSYRKPDSYNNELKQLFDDIKPHEQKLLTSIPAYFPGKIPAPTSPLYDSVWTYVNSRLKLEVCENIPYNTFYDADYIKTITNLARIYKRTQNDSDGYYATIKKYADKPSDITSETNQQISDHSDTFDAKYTTTGNPITINDELDSEDYYLQDGGNLYEIINHVYATSKQFPQYAFMYGKFDEFKYYYHQYMKIYSKYKIYVQQYGLFYQLLSRVCRQNMSKISKQLLPDQRYIDCKELYDFNEVITKLLKNNNPQHAKYNIVLKSIQTVINEDVEPRQSILKTRLFITNNAKVDLLISSTIVTAILRMYLDIKENISNYCTDTHNC